MQDVVDEIMFTGGDENLGPADPIAAVGGGFSLRLEQAEVGAALRLGQAHRAGPLAGDERLEEYFALPILTVMHERRRGAV